MSTHFRSLALLACLAFPLLGARAEFALKWLQTEARAEMRPSDEQAELQFVVTNSSDKPIRINRIESSAGNVSSLVDQRIIRAKGKSTVTAIFNKGKRTGKLHERLFVYLDGQDEPTTTLHLFVQIPILIDANPQVLYWAPDSLRSPKTLNVSLDHRYIESIEAILYDPLRLDVSREENPKKRHDFILRVVPLNFNLPLRDTIIIRGIDNFGAPAEARIQVSVRPT